MNQKKLYFVEGVFLLFFSYQITQNRKNVKNCSEKEEL